MPTLHTFPVRPGQTAEETWDELVLFKILDPPVAEPCEWATIDCGCPAGTCTCTESLA